MPRDRWVWPPWGAVARDPAAGGPGIATAAIFAFTTSWNEFLYAAALTTSNTLKTLPLGIAGFLVADSFIWGPMMAAATIATIPMVILFIVMQRFIVQGLTSGAVKG